MRPDRQLGVVIAVVANDVGALAVGSKFGKHPLAPAISPRKTWEGLAKTLFTTADNYVVHVHYRLPEPLASMVIASALTVDTALKQDDRGFN